MGGLAQRMKKGERGGLAFKGIGCVVKTKKKKKDKEAKPKKICGVVVEPEAVNEEGFAVETAVPKYDHLTESELRRKEIQDEREEKMLEERAAMNHSDKIVQFNEYLGAITEHNDMAKVASLQNG